MRKKLKMNLRFKLKIFKKILRKILKILNKIINLIIFSKIIINYFRNNMIIFNLNSNKIRYINRTK